MNKKKQIARTHIWSAISPSYTTIASAARCNERSDFTKDKIKPSSERGKCYGFGVQKILLEPASANKGTRCMRLLQLKARISVCKKLQVARHTTQTTMHNKRHNSNRPWQLVQGLCFVDHGRISFLVAVARISRTNFGQNSGGRVHSGTYTLDSICC